MYAVVRAGGKQVRVAPGQRVRVEKIDGSVGDAVRLDAVLLVSGGEQVRVGAPTVAGAAVACTITQQGRGPKVLLFKKKRRKNYRRKQGHRQAFTELRIDAIEG
jgi:large subunit ribosomal protein L21